jgi:hypothetical protein
VHVLCILLLLGVVTTIEAWLLLLHVLPGIVAIRRGLRRRRIPVGRTVTCNWLLML